MAQSHAKEQLDPAGFRELLGNQAVERHLQVELHQVLQEDLGDAAGCPKTHRLTGDRLRGVGGHGAHGGRVGREGVAAACIITLLASACCARPAEVKARTGTPHTGAEFPRWASRASPTV